jgi:hypothetical protein
MNSKTVYNISVNRDAKINVFDLRDEIDSDVIANTVLEFRSEFPESNSSNVIGWHSGYFAHKQTDKFDNLISIVEEKAKSIINDPDFNVSVVQTWAIVYEKNDAAVRHNHSDTLYSAVYYASTKPNSSPLKFDCGLSISPEPGMLVIFPGWLFHEVPAMRFQHQRIAVAFNINCTLKTYEERI